MSSLLELLVVLPLLVGIVSMDSFAIGEAADTFDGASYVYSDYVNAIRSQEYVLDGVTGNRYPIVGGSLCGLGFP